MFYLPLKCTSWKKGGPLSFHEYWAGNWVEKKNHNYSHKLHAAYYATWAEWPFQNQFRIYFWSLKVKILKGGLLPWWRKFECSRNKSTKLSLSHSNNSSTCREVKSDPLFNFCSLILNIHPTINYAFYACGIVGARLRQTTWQTDSHLWVV